METAEYNRMNRDMFRQLRLYEAGGDEQSAAVVRDRIAMLNEPMVQKIASHIRSIQYDPSAADMETMMADGMFAVAKAVRYYNDNGHKFSTYVYPIIRGEILRGVIKRKAARKELVLNMPVGTDGADMLDFGGQHDEWPAALELVDTVMFLLGLLTERERYVIRRKYYDGRSFTEVGKELGVSKQRAFSLERRGLEKMRSTVAALDAWLEK